MDQADAQMEAAMKEGAGASELFTKKRTQESEAQRTFSAERQVSTGAEVAGDGDGVAEEHAEEHIEQHIEQPTSRQAMLAKRKAYVRRMQERQLKD